MTAFPEPTDPLGSRAEVLVSYVEHFRERVVAKLAGLAPSDLTATRLPSGWSPLELALHLAHVERRWLDWGFSGAAVDDPWADERDGRWRVPDGLAPPDVVALLEGRRPVLRELVARHGLEEVGRPSERWAGRPPPTLERVLLHLLQEYARHLGQLDVVVELATGATGE